MNETIKKLAISAGIFLGIVGTGTTITMLGGSSTQPTASLVSAGDPQNDRNGDGVNDLSDALIPLQEYGAEYGGMNPCVEWIDRNRIPTLPPNHEWRDLFGNKVPLSQVGGPLILREHPWWYGASVLGTPFPYRVCTSGAQATVEWRDFRTKAARQDLTATRTPYPTHIPTTGTGPSARAH